MGVSGTLEVVGLAIWGVHLWRLLGLKVAEKEGAAGPPLRITADMKVFDIAEWHPILLDVFEAYGFKELKNPLLRRTIARRVTVRMACDLKHVREDEFLEALNRNLGLLPGTIPSKVNDEHAAPACSQPDGTSL